MRPSTRLSMCVFGTAPCLSILMSIDVTVHLFLESSALELLFMYTSTFSRLKIQAHYLSVQPGYSTTHALLMMFCYTAASILALPALNMYNNSKQCLARFPLRISFTQFTLQISLPLQCTISNGTCLPLTNANYLFPLSWEHCHSVTDPATRIKCSVSLRITRVCTARHAHDPLSVVSRRRSRSGDSDAQQCIVINVSRPLIGN